MGQWDRPDPGSNYWLAWAFVAVT